MNRTAWMPGNFAGKHTNREGNFDASVNTEAFFLQKGQKAMRKAQKKQIQEIMESLNEVHREIQKLLKQKEYATAQSVLADCQQCAIEMGNVIEESEGEECPSVKAIEVYCEKIFHFYNLIEETNSLGEPEQDTQENRKRIDEVRKDLQQQLVQVSEEIEKIAVRKEIVFFPYKASMWDSLESVYLAAKEDETCDVYCVPIPYFDKNTDGSFRQMHYEGNEYPANIEVIDWQSYNFEERRPDVIYIHNPYDSWNFITSVHPRFYAENLKKYTEELVYIPYFVLDEIEPDDQEQINEISHFCFAPGTIFADKVIVQSEKMRQIYINEFQKAAKVRNLSVDRKALEEKFLGLGSPKFDKVLNTKKEDLEIPTEWLKVIEKPDGSLKEIVFYNTSIAALLKNDEKMLEKMRDVFELFKKSQDEIALLWRPHPLIKMTIVSMRPKLWKDYEEIVTKYKEEGWGIYDDTVDMDRAVVLSDVYYGDLSSVVQVYRKTGKKVLIQRVDSKNDLKLVKKTENITSCFLPSINYTARQKDNLYFMAGDCNGLFSIDLQTGKAKFVSSMENEKKEGNFLGNTFSNEKYIVICPFNFGKIHIWDTEMERELVIRDEFNRGKPHAFLPRMTIFGEKMFLIPSYGDNGYVLDIDTCTVTREVNIRNEYQRILGKNYKILTKDRGYLYKNCIYFSTFEDNCICEYTTEENSILFHRVSVDTSILLSVGYQGNLYLLGKDGVVYVWDIELKEVKRQCVINPVGNRDINFLQDKAVVGDNIYFMSPGNTWGIKYSTSRNQAEVNNYEKMFQINTKENEEYHFSSQDEAGNMYFISNQYNLAIVNATDQKASVLPLQFDYRQLKKFWFEDKESVDLHNSVGYRIVEYLS